jgi:hypothetical protein
MRSQGRRALAGRERREGTRVTWDADLSIEVGEEEIYG